MYFFANDYVKFVSNLRYYCDGKVRLINACDSHHYDELMLQGNINVPIGLLGDDVEVVFLHYHSESEVKDKWARRCERICWNNIILKFSEMNSATLQHLQIIDKLPYQKKVIFTTRDYGLNSQVVFKEWLGASQIRDDTTHFRRYVNLVDLINGDEFRKRR